MLFRDLAMVAFWLAFGCIASVTAQTQCDPQQYTDCAASIDSIGYPATCDSVTSCRDCIGCNQACPWAPCAGTPGCSASDYIQAANVITANKDNLGWLYLCCESNDPSAKCVGCQQANIFGILCNMVYPPLNAVWGQAAPVAPVPDALGAWPHEDEDEFQPALVAWPHKDEEEMDMDMDMDTQFVSRYGIYVDAMFGLLVVALALVVSHLAYSLFRKCCGSNRSAKLGSQRRVVQNQEEQQFL